jgi:hypothetical protein
MSAIMQKSAQLFLAFSVSIAAAGVLAGQTPAAPAPAAPAAPATSAPPAAPAAGTAPAPAPTTPSAPPAANGAARPLADQTAAEIMKAVTELANQLDAAKGRKNSEALRAFQDAVQTDDKAYNLWAQCKKQVDFDDKGKTGSEWGEWKRSPESQRWHDADAGCALKTQLQWLVLTLQAANATTETAREGVLAQIPAFLSGLMDNWKRMGDFRREAMGDVMNTVYARYFKLDQTLDRDPKWVYSPANIDEVYDRLVLPYLRVKKNLQGVTTAWQNRIRYETEMMDMAEREAKLSKNGNNERRAAAAEEDAIKFKEQKLPRLQWWAMKDAFLLGNEAGTAPSMLSHIRAHLGHRDADNWLRELIAMLKHEELPSPQTPAPAAAEAPARPASPAFSPGAGASSFGPGTRPGGGRGR